MFQRVWSRLKATSGSPLSDLYIPARYTYVIDLTLNKTDQVIPMGQPGTSWAYNVYPLGKPMPNGGIADENAARLYPYRRLMISSEDCLMYDGPAFDWHGEFPGIPFTLDDWAWEALGLSIVRDGYAIQQSINELERGIMDKHRSNLDPALGYDINAVTRNEADSFDPMQPRARIGFDGSQVERPFQEVMAPEAKKVDPATQLFITHLEETLDYQLANRDIVALAKARALGGGVDNVDKMMEADGPIVRDISRGVERSITKTGNQVKYIVIQFYDTGRVMRYVGADGITTQTLDYDPNSLVPSHLVGEDPNAGASKFDKYIRGRRFADSLNLTIVPHSAHEITQMSHKLGLIQMKKAGVQISSKTIAKSWDLHDWEAELKLWKDEQEMIAEFALRIKQITDSIMQAGVSPPPAAMAALAALSGGQTQEGRPPSGQQSPTLNEKDQGARSTISESGT